ncbi:tRNA dihydrouridine(16) synthase DusC [Glaciecola sp. XM2]|uniref:tRNA dihydrouridine(16) synthase DusC n=1 Tax=Glaciecola sp. XM2 TaxID=1914931 RepID=UPI001BDE8D78|nr:tRNA dihydrouridine(16) synthase DusC [Glaciecola sp. XM2]
MKIFLAPMEGVVDHLMRDMLTQVGGFDMCITEFLRVVEQVHPVRTFHKICPELKSDGLTPSGVPVRVQLLGQHPQWLAENAFKAVSLGSHGVDLNFGCPAKTVNKSKGGAVLLKEPNSLYNIVKAVRDAVPQEHAVSAKIRLGFDDTSLALENADAITQAGANMLTVHARTKVDGYKPPAYWDWIAKIKNITNIHLIANGEIWHAKDAVNCQAQSNTEDLMLGRGALSLPNLANCIKYGETPMDWDAARDLLVHYSGYEIFGDKGRYYPNRIKQWLGYLQREYTEAADLFQQVRTLRDSDSIVSVIQSGAHKP